MVSPPTKKSVSSSPQKPALSSSSTGSPQQNRVLRKRSASETTLSVPGNVTPLNTVLHSPKAPPLSPAKLTVKLETIALPRNRSESIFNCHQIDEPSGSQRPESCDSNELHDFSGLAVQEDKTATPPKKPRTVETEIQQAPPSRELWEAYGLDCEPCKLGNCLSKSKCKNPYCLNKLGNEKWESLLNRYRNKVEKEYPGREVETSPAGLKNLGNTCYLNSYLQVWFHLLPFRQAVFNWERLPEGFWAAPQDGTMNTEETMLALQHLFISLQGAPFETFSPKRIVRALNLNTEQQDALEFGQLFLSALQETVNQYTNGHDIAAMLKEQFEGSSTQLIECDRCHVTSRSQVPFTELTLGIEGHKNVASALSAYFSEETLEKRCGSCTSNSGTRKVQFSKVPPILVLQLNRFVYDRDQGKKRKLQQPLSFSRQLDLTPFMDKAPKNSEPLEYELNAILVHQGPSAYMGHYYALIEDQEREKWYKFNDEAVTELTGKKIPGTEDESGSTSRASTLSNSTEAKGAYMLVYRRKEGKACRRSKISMPKHCSKVLENLREHYEKAKKDFESDRDKKLKRAKDKAKRMQQLWKELQVEIPGDEIRLESVVALFPSEFLKEIQRKEAADLGLKEETGQSEKNGNEEMKIVDVSEEICNGWRKEGEKGDLGEDPMDSLERESKGVIQAVVPVSIADKPVQVDFPKEEWKCDHGKIPLKEVKDGKWRAVNVEGALQLMASHCQNSPDQEPLTMFDLCDACVNSGLTEEEFKKILDQDAEIVAKDVKSTKIGLTKDCLIPALRRDCFWVSKRDISKFKSVATEHGKRPKTGSESNRSNQKEDPFLTDDSSDSSVSGAVVENEHVFNEDLLCDHGGFSTESNKRRLVDVRIWSLVKKYFPTAKEFVSTELECVVCQYENAGNQEEMKKYTGLRDYYLKNLDSLKKSGIGREIENFDFQDGAAYIVCRSYFQDWLRFLRAPKSFDSCKRICNECLLCDHGNVKYPLESSQYVNGPMAEMVECELTSVGQIDQNRLFVILSGDEWGKLCFPEGMEEFFVDVDTDITVKKSPGGLIMSPKFCDECFAKLLTDKQNEQFHFDCGKIYVQKVEEETDEKPESVENQPGTSNSLNFNGKIVPGMANIPNIFTRRSNRRAKKKDASEYTINSRDTVQDLKIKIMAREVGGPTPVEQHLTYRGEELSELGKTIFDYKIPEGATLRLKIDARQDFDDVMAEVEKERARSPERGFQGSVLSGRK